MDSTQQLLAVLIGNVVLVSLVAIIGGFLHHRRERLLTHQERMKALELGRDLPDDPAIAWVKAVSGSASSGSEDHQGQSTADGNTHLPRKLFTTALWVAFWGFLFAMQGAPANPAVAIAIAVSTGAIGVTAMICGTILAMGTAPNPSQSHMFKPSIESDAFDVVSQRG